MSRLVVTRRTRTAWLVVDSQGVLAGFSCGEVGLRKARAMQRYARGDLSPARLVRATYPWPPAKKRRRK